MNYQCATDSQDVKEYLSGAGIVAFDFETAPLLQYRDDPKASLDAHRACIVGISLSHTPGSAIYIPLHHLDGNNADKDVIVPYLKEALFANHGVIKVAHYLAFESMFLYALGIILQPPCYDTIAAAQMTLKTRYEFRGLLDSGLKKLVPELLGIELPSFEDVTQGRFFDELPSHAPETVRYACADSDYALRLYYRFNQWFEQSLPKHRWIVEYVESPTAVYCGLMKHNGILMDKAAMVRKQGEAIQKLKELQNQIRSIIGEVPLGANASTKAFKDYLYQELKLPILKVTGKNKEAADDETMILLTEWCQEHRPELVRLIELVQAYRKWSKLKATYIDGYIEQINIATGRIHPDLLPLATETGRFASRKPNMQNCPRQSNDPIGVRSFMIAPEGKVLLTLDFSQIELRVGAFYCRDQMMLQTYQTGGDIHAQTTAVIFGIPFEQAADKHAPDYKERRTIAKNCNFGTFFGLYAKGLQRTLRFKAGLSKSLNECDGIIRSLKAGYPALERWQKETRNTAARRRFTETYLGRRRYLPSITTKDWGKRSYAERSALNTPIQGTAADILKLALGRIVIGLPDRPWLKPLLQIHDELIFEIPEAKLEEAVAFVKTCMEAKPFPAMDIPIIADASYGHNFGALEELS